MFNTWQVAGLSILDGPFSPCHAPESALGLDLSPGSSFYFFSDLGLYIADIVTDLLNGVHWITKDDIIWGGITVISFFMLYVEICHFLRCAEICKNSMCVMHCFCGKY